MSTNLLNRIWYEPRLERTREWGVAITLAAMANERGEVAQFTGLKKNRQMDLLGTSIRATRQTVWLAVDSLVKKGLVKYDDRGRLALVVETPPPSERELVLQALAKDLVSK